jgi:hypothetical protein
VLLPVGLSHRLLLPLLLLEEVLGDQSFRTEPLCSMLWPLLLLLLPVELQLESLLSMWPIPEWCLLVLASSGSTPALFESGFAVTVAAAFDERLHSLLSLLKGHLMLVNMRSLHALRVCMLGSLAKGRQEG